MHLTDGEKGHSRSEKGARFADADPKMMLEMYRMLKKLSGLVQPKHCNQIGENKPECSQAPLPSF